jgi:hypothetical protein
MTLTYQLDQKPGENLDGYGLRQVTVNNTDPPSGRRMVADFIGSDSSLSIYRRFGALAARRLLMLQLEISRLERQWKTLDKEINIQHDQCSEEAYERGSRLESLLSSIDEKLKRYRTLILPL